MFNKEQREGGNKKSVNKCYLKKARKHNSYNWEKEESGLRDNDLPILRKMRC